MLSYEAGVGWRGRSLEVAGSCYRGGEGKAYGLFDGEGGTLVGYDRRLSEGGSGAFGGRYAEKGTSRGFKEGGRNFES